MLDNLSPEIIQDKTIVVPTGPWSLRRCHSLPVSDAPLIRRRSGGGLAKPRMAEESAVIF
jgi:hypothetical protein